MVKRETTAQGDDPENGAVAGLPPRPTVGTAGAGIEQPLPVRGRALVKAAELVGAQRPYQC